MADSPGRLLVEAEPHDGAWNMAFDEALLEAAANRGEVSLRIYRWSEPTLSLGYFQKAVPQDLPDSLRELPCVRRLSGGGAILHHHEWTYSCALPKGHCLSTKTERLYDEIHAAFVRAFARLGIDARMRGVSDRAANGRFLCFERGDARDVLVQGRKIVGSAQRRRRGAVLQHGSVLLRKSEFSQEIVGLTDLLGGILADPLFAATEFVEESCPSLFEAVPSRSPDIGDIEFARANTVQYRIPPEAPRGNPGAQSGRLTS